MSPLQSKKPSEKDLLIEQVKEQIAHAEAHGQFDTAHHEVLRQLLKGDKPEPKQE